MSGLVVDQIVAAARLRRRRGRGRWMRYTARDLMEWYRETPFRDPEDWVFASNSNRAGRKRASNLCGWQRSCVITSAGGENVWDQQTSHGMPSGVLLDATSCNGENVKWSRSCCSIARPRYDGCVYAGECPRNGRRSRSRGDGGPEAEVRKKYQLGVR